MKKLKLEKTIFLTCLIICLIILIVSGLDVKAMQLEIKKLEYQNSRQAAQLQDQEMLLEIQDILIRNQDEIIQQHIDQMGEPDEPEYIGEYTLTAYCSCETCCGEWALNRPNGKIFGAAGIELQEGISVASPLPFGTKLLIFGQEYIVQDRTAEWVSEKYEEKIVDLYFENHVNAEAFGKQIADVWIVEENNG